MVVSFPEHARPWRVDVASAVASAVAGLGVRQPHSKFGRPQLRPQLQKSLTVVGSTVSIRGVACDACDNG